MSHPLSTCPRPHHPINFATLTEATPSRPEAAPQSIFATTHWSVILTAGRVESPHAQAALEQLCQTYWHPLYVYARRRGYSPADAEDLTQEFFAWILKRNWLERADQQRGRFRSFLLTSMSNFLSNEWGKANAQKRGGGRIVSLQVEQAEGRCQGDPTAAATPEKSFEWRWALTLLDQVMNRLSAEFVRDNKSELFEKLKPCLLGESAAQPYATLAPQLGMTEGALKVAVHRLRQRYRQLLREEIAHTVAQPGEIDEEMRHLFATLSGQ